MGVLVVLIGFIAVIYGLAGLPYMYDKGIGYFIYALFLEALFCFLFVLFLRKYKNSPEYKEKQRKREEWIANEPAREEEERKRTTIVSTRLIGKGKKRVGNVLFGSIIGAIFAGKAGAALGGAAAMHKNSKIRIFLVKYLDGHTEKKEAAVGSLLYEEYMKYLIE